MKLAFFSAKNVIGVKFRNTAMANGTNGTHTNGTYAVSEISLKYLFLTATWNRICMR